MKLLPRRKQTDSLVVAISAQQCRLHHFQKAEHGLRQVAAVDFNYTNLKDLRQQLVDWVKQQSIKGTPCRWVLGRDHYQTFNVEPPQVQEKELDEALKWQMKDLIEMSVEEALVTHYVPTRDENTASNNNIEVIVAAKTLIEECIDISKEAGLELESIDVDELTVGHALLPQLDNERITGFIGEDEAGLIFNFYWQGGLAFSRYRKAKFMPKSPQGFSLEEDKEAQEEAFILETQRTLDYVASQIFRRPVETILLQDKADVDDGLSELIKQVTEIEVNTVRIDLEKTSDDHPEPQLAEIGAALNAGSV